VKPNLHPRAASLLFVVLSLLVGPIIASGADTATTESGKASDIFGVDVFDRWGDWPENPDRIPYFKEPVFAYRAYMTDLARIPSAPAADDCPKLPDTLIIPPGTYQFRGRAFSLDKEGLVRFLEVNEELQQRIVYEKDPHALLSGIAWIVSHGRPDGGKSAKEKAEAAKTRKLLMTCGSVSGWAVSVLREHGCQARGVSSITLENWNTYDNGHAMLELFWKDPGKWVLYDVTANAYFTFEGKPLSLVEFAYAVMAEKDYDVVPIAADTTLDVSGFRSPDGTADYTFHAERIFGDARQWHRHILEVPMIGGYFFDEANREKIEGYAAGFKYLDKDEFRRKFYGDPPNEK
jgi:hypothetical protein